MHCELLLFVYRFRILISWIAILNIQFLKSQWALDIRLFTIYTTLTFRHFSFEQSMNIPNQFDKSNGIGGARMYNGKRLSSNINQSQCQVKPVPEEQRAAVELMTLVALLGGNPVINACESAREREKEPALILCSVKLQEFPRGVTHWEQQRSVPIAHLGSAFSFSRSFSRSFTSTAASLCIQTRCCPA